MRRRPSLIMMAWGARRGSRRLAMRHNVWARGLALAGAILSGFGGFETPPEFYTARFYTARFYTAFDLRDGTPVSERAGFRSAMVVIRFTWSVTHTRNIGWRAFLSNSITRPGESSR